MKRYRNIAVLTSFSLAVAFALLLFAGLAPVLSAAPDSSGYHIVKKITTGGTEGWDYITMDSDARLAYIGLVRGIPEWLGPYFEPVSATAIPAPGHPPLWIIELQARDVPLTSTS